jgi:hypothetical protein
MFRQRGHRGPVFLTFVRNKKFMRTLFLAAIASVLFMTSCSNKGSGTAKTFCDTACNNDSLNFKGDNKLNPVVLIGIRDCKADSMMWMHDLADSKLVSLPQYLGQDVSLNKSAIDCYFKDTSYAWLQFNDCKTGRGYALKLPFSKGQERQTISSAFTKFDPKFSIDPDLIAYTDRGSVFVENMKTGQKSLLPFDKVYQDINFNKLHESVDSIHVTKDRIFVQMIRDGEKVPYEKKINL